MKCNWPDSAHWFSYSAILFLLLLQCFYFMTNAEFLKLIPVLRKNKTFLFGCSYPTFITVLICIETTAANNTVLVSDSDNITFPLLHQMLVSAFKALHNITFPCLFPTWCQMHLSCSQMAPGVSTFPASHYVFQQTLLSVARSLMLEKRFL